MNNIQSMLPHRFLSHLNQQQAQKYIQNISLLNKPITNSNMMTQNNRFRNNQTNHISQNSNDMQSGYDIKLEQNSQQVSYGGKEYYKKASQFENIHNNAQHNAQTNQHNNQNNQQNNNQPNNSQQNNNQPNNNQQNNQRNNQHNAIYKLHGSNQSNTVNTNININPNFNLKAMNNETFPSHSHTPNIHSHHNKTITFNQHQAQHPQNTILHPQGENQQTNKQSQTNLVEQPTSEDDALRQEYSRLWYEKLALESTIAKLKEESRKKDEEIDQLKEIKSHKATF